MKTVIILSCVFGIALCVPVVTREQAREPQPLATFPSPIQSDALDQQELVRRRRQLFGLDVNVYNNNGYGYFDNGYGGGFGGYPGYGYGGFGYPGYGGFGYPGYGGFGGGYGGFGGYPGFGYGGFF